MSDQNAGIPVDPQQVIRHLADRVAGLSVQVAQWEAAYDALAREQQSPTLPSGAGTRD